MGRKKKISDDTKENVLPINENFENLEDIEQQQEVSRLIHEGVPEKISEDLCETVDYRDNKFNIDGKLYDHSTKKNKKKSKLSNKERLIEDIFKHAKISGFKLPNKTEVSRKTVEQLEVLLSEITGDVINQIGRPEEIKGENHEEIGPAPVISDYEVNALYNFNLLIAKLLEHGSIAFQDTEGIKEYIPNLKGYGDKIYEEKRREELKACLREILARHGNVIKPMLNPIAAWVCIMVEAGAEAHLDNLKNVSLVAS